MHIVYNRHVGDFDPIELKKKSVFMKKKEN